MQAATGRALSASAGRTRTAGTADHSGRHAGRTSPTTAAAKVNHFICWRSIPRERRNRTTSATTEATSEPQISTLPVTNSNVVGAPATARGCGRDKSAPRSGLSGLARVEPQSPPALARGADRHRRHHGAAERRTGLRRGPSGQSRKARTRARRIAGADPVGRRRTPDSARRTDGPARAGRRVEAPAMERRRRRTVRISARRRPGGRTRGATTRGGGATTRSMTGPVWERWASRAAGFRSARSSGRRSPHSGRGSSRRRRLGPPRDSQATDPIVHLAAPAQRRRNSG